MTILCCNCGLAEPFEGWDDCLKCGVAVALVEDPGYLEFARKVFAKDAAWLAKLEAEWNRQASALAAAKQVAA